MSNVIELLERMGATASFGRPQTDALMELGGQDLAVEQREALLGCDVQALNRMLRGRATMFCMIATPDGAEEHDVPDQTEDEPDRDNEPQES